MAGSKILFVAVSGTVGVVASVATHTDHTALVLFGCGLLGLCLLVLIIIAGVLFVPQDHPADRLLNLLKTGDLEQAAACGRDALRSAATLSSTIVTDRLRLLDRQVAPLRTASPYLADLDDRITEHLPCSARDHHTDTTL